MFQHTAARRRLPTARNDGFITLDVSTHSRPKAAACELKVEDDEVEVFQHTAARRRLRAPKLAAEEIQVVSTHSRPKAAA